MQEACRLCQVKSHLLHVTDARSLQPLSVNASKCPIYCSKECQKLEWPGHSDVCKKTTSTPPTKLSPVDQGKARVAEGAGSKKAPYTPTKCSNCNKVKSSLKRCACKNASYCSVECQRLHWLQHKSTCTATKK